MCLQQRLFFPPPSEYGHTTSQWHTTTGQALAWQSPAVILGLNSSVLGAEAAGCREGEREDTAPQTAPRRSWPVLTGRTVAGPGARAWGRAAGKKDPAAWRAEERPGVMEEAVHLEQSEGNSGKGTWPGTRRHTMPEGDSTMQHVSLRGCSP